MPHHTPLIAILSVGFVLAFALGTLAHRLRLSPLVGYLLAGIVVGPFTPGFVADQALALELSEIGVILLMFGVGLHFSLDDLLKVKNIAVPGAIVQIGAATVLGWALAAWMGWPTMQGLVFGLALSVASTVVLLRAMEDRRLLDTPRGRIAVGWLIVEDLVMVLTLVLLPALAAAFAENGDGQMSVGSVLISLAITMGKVTAFVVLMLVVGRRAIPWLLERVAGTGSRELFTLCILAIAMGVAFGSAHLFGVSFALGAFFAGMLLNESELSHQAANDSLPMRDAFAVLFFVSVGMLFDPAVLLQQPLQVLATFLIIVFGKSIAAYAIVRLFGHPNDTALTISASLAQTGEFSFILAGLGVSLAVLPTEGRDLILAGAILSIIANPFLFVLLDRWQTRRDASQAMVNAQTADELPAGPALVAQDHVVVVGYGRVGTHLANLLRERELNLVVIDSNPDHVELAHAAGFPAIRGNASSPRVLKEAHAHSARLAVIAVAQALEAGEIVTRLREANPIITVFARAHSEAEVRHVLEHGADAAVLAERELACSMADMVMATPPFRTLAKRVV
ncbi:MAG: YbaL family putative K(+) efflux transporter [Pseudomarimonas sp.]